MVEAVINSTDESPYLLWQPSSLSVQGLHAEFQLVELGMITFERQFGQLSVCAEGSKYLPKACPLAQNLVPRRNLIRP
jgi:hypothetical protein